MKWGQQQPGRNPYSYDQAGEETAVTISRHKNPCSNI